MPLSSSAVAVATTVHVALFLLRAHRNPPGRRFDVLLIPALILAVTPWLLPDVLGLVAGLALQLGWFVACERLAGRSGEAAQASPHRRPPPHRLARQLRDRHRASSQCR